MRADLHIHTTASDGCWTPQGVVSQVRAARIALFAVADHDTVTHVAPVADLARREGIAFIPAAEVSAAADGLWLHILAYGVDTHDVSLNRLLQRNEEKLGDYNDQTLYGLIDAGYPLDTDAYASYRYDPARGGWKVLNYLIDKGICSDVHDFFRICNDPSVRPPRPDFAHAAEVVDAITAAGGLPVLAHPGMSLRTQGLTEQNLMPLLEYGIAGLECHACYHDEEATHICLEFCRQHDLLITGGSDCHGGFAGRQLGVPMVHVEELRLGALAAYTAIQPDPALSGHQEKRCVQTESATQP